VNIQYFYLYHLGPVTVSSRPSWRKPDKTPTAPLPGDDGEGPLVEAGTSVLGLYFTSPAPGALDGRAQSAVSRDLPFLQNKSTVVK